MGLGSGGRSAQAVGGIDPLLGLKDTIIHLSLSSWLSPILPGGRHISLDGNFSANLL